MKMYGPELNTIEGLWGRLKRSALNNYFYVDIASLEKAVGYALRELRATLGDYVVLGIQKIKELTKKRGKSNERWAAKAINGLLKAEEGIGKRYI